MATKKVKKEVFQPEVYVYFDQYDQDSFSLVANDIEDTATKQGTKVGVYQLVKVVTVKTKTVVEE
jgi:hypothetical protein